MGGAGSGQCCECRVAGRRRRTDEQTLHGLVHPVVLLVGKEERLVLPNRAADLSAEADIVEGGIDDGSGGLRARSRGVDRVEVPVLEIFVHPTMPVVCSADDGLVELTA